jgi:hypothetical protein
VESISWLLQRSDRIDQSDTYYISALLIRIACCRHYKKREWCVRLLQMITVQVNGLF